ncbi:hypothetical protein WMY93_009514 [Mugilogobius chulae]|uniref:Uncharacterized protein n=1 Tax=Mugilogobius chulae TaxID=88201 RepID=A0AAW0PMN9_9GOBI
MKKSGLVTVVLSSCVQGKLQSEEDAFWACAYRLHWALKDKSLLPGAGVTEMFCIHQLQKQARLYAAGHETFPSINTKTAAGPYTGVVLQLMADGLIDFVSNVMVNTGKYSKVEARTVIAEQLNDRDGSVNCAKMFRMCVEDEPADCCGEKTICDNLTVKQEAWRKALDLVCLVLQTDAEVITGCMNDSASIPRMAVAFGSAVKECKVSQTLLLVGRSVKPLSVSGRACYQSSARAHAN